MCDGESPMPWGENILTPLWNHGEVCSAGGGPPNGFGLGRKGTSPPDGDGIQDDAEGFESSISSGIVPLLTSGSTLGSSCEGDESSAVIDATGYFCSRMEVQVS